LFSKVALSKNESKKSRNISQISPYIIEKSPIYPKNTVPRFRWSLLSPLKEIKRLPQDPYYYEWKDVNKLKMSLITKDSESAIRTKQGFDKDPQYPFLYFKNTTYIPYQNANTVQIFSF
jgi:hypothetical protein